MDDANLILILVAEGDKAKGAFSHKLNRDRHHGPLKKKDENASESSSDAVSRGTTPSISGYEEDESEIHQILLRFDDLRKDIGRGFGFGKDEHRCDVFLPYKPLSQLHFRITFDEKHQLILEDTSKNGTWVSYGDEKDPDPRNYRRFLLLPDRGSIKVTIGKLCFRIEFPNHASCEAQFQTNVKLYLERSQKADPPLNLLNFDIHETTAPLTGLPAPNQDPKYHRSSVIGRGDFGIVYEAWDASTGDPVALKEVYRGNWNREVEILRSISHVSIIVY